MSKNRQSFIYDESSLCDYKIADDGAELLRVRDKNATSLVVPSELGGRPVKRLDSSAFSDCAKLTQIVLPSTLTEIGAFAFSDCSALESLDLPASLESIDAKAFDGCDALTTIRVAPGNAQIRVVDGLLLTRGGKTLTFCPRTKTGVCVVPESVEEVEPQAFHGCDALTQIVLSPNVTSIAPARSKPVVR